jgi:DNA-binding response OmpR family regulator
VNACPRKEEVGPVTRGRVLAIDDEEDVLALVAELLDRAGFTVTAALGGEAGLTALQAGLDPDLVILDISMPGLDGWGVLERIRAASEVPVLMLTARTSELDKVRGLRSGADDYVAKPFGRQELLARVEALLRRSAGRTGIDDTYVDSVCRIDFLQRRVEVKGVELALTPLEFRLLSALVRNAGQVLGHEQLLDLVWRDSFGISPEEVRTYVSYLRKKLRATGLEHEPIETIRGFGYRYRLPGA